MYQAILNGADEAEIERIAWFYDYLEIQPIANNAFLAEEGRVRDEDELREINRKIVELGGELGKPVVATGDVHFMQPEDEIFRRIIMAGHGFADLERPSPLYLRTTDEMLEEFSYLGDEEAARVVIDDPRAIADRWRRCGRSRTAFIRPRIEKAEERDSKDGLGRPPGKNTAIRRRRPSRKGFTGSWPRSSDNGYASLYLIAHQLIERSVEEGYMVGSRGSVGSSLVAHLCGISEVNPLPPHYCLSSLPPFRDVRRRPCTAAAWTCPKGLSVVRWILRRDGFDIPFETFLGFEGDKVPDIDLNFAGDYQAEAHKYAEELLGEGERLPGRHHRHRSKSGRRTDTSASTSIPKAAKSLQPR